MADRTTRELEDKIAEIKRRIPPHSVPPAMLQELDQLEQELDLARPEEDQA